MANPRNLRHSIRIIAGNLRGSKLAVPDAPALRPTPDRVRETLFNWLQPYIEGARCLDAFAGTGALGIEALSRGAAHAHFIERDNGLVTLLRENLTRLKQTEATVQLGDAVHLFKLSPMQRFDIVFLDPPFGAGLWAAAADALESGGWLRESALIYLESPLSDPPELPENWQQHRQSHAGNVRYALYQRGDASAKLRATQTGRP